MSDLLNLVDGFTRLKDVLTDSCFTQSSGYYKDYALAQSIIIDEVLQNNHIHGYTRERIQVFLLGLGPQKHWDSDLISDKSYFAKAFKEYLETITNDISINRLCGLKIKYL